MVNKNHFGSFNRSEGGVCAAEVVKINYPDIFKLNILSGHGRPEKTRFPRYVPQNVA